MQTKTSTSNVEKGILESQDTSSESTARITSSTSLTSSLQEDESTRTVPLINEETQPEPEPVEGEIRVPSGSGFRVMTPFPWRLHEILQDIEERNLDWIVKWMPDGKSFQVVDQERFQNVILPMYFRHNRYKSFQRQLYLYGFRALNTNNISKGAYFHPNFVKEQRTLCSKIVRHKQTSNTSSTSRRGGNKRRSRPSNVSSSSSVDSNSALLTASFDPISLYREDITSRFQSIPHKVSEGMLTNMVSETHGLTGITSSSLQIPLSNPDMSSGLLESYTHGPYQDRGGLPFTSGVEPHGSAADLRFQRPNASFSSQPITTVALGNSWAMNLESSCPDQGVATDLEPKSTNLLTSNSIQKLEPFSDSIITLFGSQSNFSV